MKTLIKNILLAVPVVLSTSCSSWLEEDPKTFISPSSFYQTVEDFDGALKGLYPQDQNLNLTEVFADYNDKPESAEQVGDIWANNPGYGFYAFRGAWSGSYSTIKNTNMILAEIENKDFSAETKIVLLVKRDVCVLGLTLRWFSFLAMCLCGIKSFLVMRKLR